MCATGPTTPDRALCLQKHWQTEAGYDIAPSAGQISVHVRFEEDPGAPAAEYPACCVLTARGLEALGMTHQAAAQLASKIRGMERRLGWWYACEVLCCR